MTRSKASPTCCATSRSRPPPNVGDGWRTLIDAARQGRGLARLSLSQQRDVLDLFTKSARSFLDSWFESEAVKAAFGFDAVVGNYASPDTPGSAYVLLHHVFGEVNGKKGAWGHAIGGMGAITQIMAKVCTRTRRRDQPRQRRSRACWSMAARRPASSWRAARKSPPPASIANVGPKLLYERMFDEGDIAARVPPPDQGLQGRLGHLPHERRAQRAAALHLPARTRRASPVGHHPRADARLHGQGLPRREGNMAGRRSRSSRC